MKINTSLKIVALVLLSFSLISTVSVFYELSKMAQDANVVNYSGMQREISQRLARMLFAKHKGINTEKEIAELTSKLDRVIKGLVHGDAEMGLPEATDEKFIAKMKEIESVWEEYKDTMKRADKDEKTLQELFNDSESILKLADEATTIAASASKSKVKTLKSIQIILFILNLIILTGIYIAGRKKIADPLRKLTEDVVEISKGNLRINVVCGKKDDEINMLACAMDTMVTSLNNIIDGILTSANDVVSVDIAFLISCPAEATSSKNSTQFSA